jgi:hypothetical protein
MVNRKELVFCADRGDDYYGWFWHEADVLLYALGQEVRAKITTAAEARELYAKHYDVEDTYLMPPEDVEDEKALILKDWEKHYTLEKLEELLEGLVGEYDNFPLNEELDHLPNSRGFWQEAADLGIPGVEFLNDVFDVGGREALDALRGEVAEDYRIVVKEDTGEYGLSHSAEARALIERERRGDIG